LVEVRPPQRGADEMLERVAHRAGLGMTRIEEDEHEVRDVDDLLRDAQYRSALLVGVEAWRVDEDAAAQLAAVGSLELQISVEPLPFADDGLVDLGADAVQREARIVVERDAGQDARRLVPAVA